MNKKLYKALISVLFFLFLLSSAANMDEMSDSLMLSIIMIQGFYIIDAIEQKQ